MAQSLGLVKNDNCLLRLQLPVSQLEPQAEVVVLAVHIKAFVKATKLGIGLLAYQHEHAGYPVRLRRRAVSRQAAAQQLPGGDEPAIGLGCRLARLDHAGCQQARILLGSGQQCPQRAAAQADVGVQNKEPRRRTMLEGLIMVLAKPQRLMVADAFDGKFEDFFIQGDGLGNVDG